MRFGGRHERQGLEYRSRAFDFFDGRGALEAIARELALPKVRFRRFPPKMRLICSPVARPRCFLVAT